MNKFKMLFAASFAVLAVGAIVASAAFATEGEWLVEGVSISIALRAESEGEILLINYATANNLAEVLVEILCSGIFVGHVGPGTAGDVTEVLTLAQGAVGSDNSTLTGSPVLCDVTGSKGSVTDCEVGNALAELWPANLPWKTTNELMAGADTLTVFSGNGAGEPGYEVECIVFGIKVANLCTSPAGATTTLIENFATGAPASVLGFFNVLEDPQLANCTLTGEHTGEVISDEGKSGDTWVAETELARLATSVVE
jgi:hypothetical protein